MTEMWENFDGGQTAGEGITRRDQASTKTEAHHLADIKILA